jgi:hypothetical protein
VSIDLPFCVIQMLSTERLLYYYSGSGDRRIFMFSVLRVNLYFLFLNYVLYMKLTWTSLFSLTIITRRKN